MIWIKIGKGSEGSFQNMMEITGSFCRTVMSRQAATQTIEQFHYWMITNTFDIQRNISLSFLSLQIVPQKGIWVSGGVSSHSPPFCLLSLYSFYSSVASEGPSSFLVRSMPLEILGMFLHLLLEDTYRSLIIAAIIPQILQGRAASRQRNFSFANLDYFAEIFCKQSLSLLCLPAGGYIHRKCFSSCVLWSINFRRYLLIHLQHIIS